MTPAIPFGSAEALFRHNQTPKTYMETTQDIAIVVCGGGDPFAEYTLIENSCKTLGLKTVTFVGNDMIARFPDTVDHGVTLHPEKLGGWMAERNTNGFAPIPRFWAHRPGPNVTDWTRDWSGSTGLMCVKIARELGHTHVVLCGVHMTVDGNHFVRNEPWKAAHGFRRGWTGRLVSLKNYVRSYGGWTLEMFGVPTDEWLDSSITDKDRLDIPPKGEKA